MISYQLAYVQQLHIAEGLRRSYNDSGSILNQIWLLPDLNFHRTWNLTGYFPRTHLFGLHSSQNCVFCIWPWTFMYSFFLCVLFYCCCRFLRSVSMTFTLWVYFPYIIKMIMYKFILICYIIIFCTNKIQIHSFILSAITVWT